MIIAMKERCLIIPKELLFYIFISIPFYSSSFVDRFAYLDNFFKGWKLISLMCIIVCILHFNISNVTFLIIVSELYLVVVTILRNADLKRALGTVFPIISMLLVYELGKNNFRVFIQSQYIIFSVLIYCNFLCEVAFPRGMFISPLTHYWQNWILGYYNNHSVYYIPAICIALLYGKIKKNNTLVFVLIMVIAISAIIVKSGGVLAALLAMGVYWGVLRKKRFLGFFFSWGCGLAFFLIIVVMRTRVVVDFLTNIFEQSIGKGRSFIARYKLWGVAIEHIMDKPFVGHGIEGQIARLREYGWGLHAHNLILELLHQGGIIYFALFLIVLFICGKKCSLCSNRFVSSVVSCGCFGWVIATLVEPFYNALLMPILLLAYYSEEISEAVDDEPLVCSNNEFKRMKEKAI